MSLKRFRFSKTFVRERCDFCGRCFAECPVLELPIAEAQREIRALEDTGESPVLDRCTGCMACNSICPTDANPHTLILNSWEKRYLAKGLPARAGLVLPYRKPNLYTILREHLPADEKALVDEWEANWRNPPQSETMVYAGCNLILQPFLAKSGLFDGIPIFGSTDLCCGEPLYRMGCWDAVRMVARHLQREFARMGCRRIIVPCLAGYHLFRHVYPEVLGVPIDCEIVSAEEWFLERLDAGEVAVKPLNQRAVVHDNCWPKASGDVLFDSVRSLLARLGVEVVEPPHTREMALCCGMCAGAARFSMRDILRVMRGRLRELDRTDADFALNYCGGCNWLFGLADQLSLKKCSKPVYHVLEVIAMATGNPVPHRTGELAAEIIAQMKGRLARSYLTRKRFHFEEIMGEAVSPRGNSR